MTVMLSLSLVITINGHSNDHLITPCATTRGVSCRATPQQRDALSCNCNGKLLLVRPMQATQTEETTGVRSLTASRDCDHQLLSGAEGGWWFTRYLAQLAAERARNSKLYTLTINAADQEISFTISFSTQD